MPLPKPFYIRRKDAIEQQKEHDDEVACIRARWAGILQVIALCGIFAIAIIYDGEWLYAAMGAGMVVLGIKVQQVLGTWKKLGGGKN